MNAKSEPVSQLEAAMTEAARALPSAPALAAKKAEKILKTAPGYAPALLLLGVARRKAGEMPAAIRALESLVRAHPRWAPGHYQLGVTLGAIGRIEQALSAMRRAVGLQPDISNGWRQIVDYLVALGDPAGADRAYANHIAVSTGNPALRAPAAALCEDRLAEAEQLLRSHIERHADDAAAIHMLAEVASRLGREADAERLLARCLELAPEFHPARHKYAIVLHQLGKTTESLAELERLLASDSKNPSYLNLKANALTRIGEYDKAIEAFSAVLADHRSHPKIWIAYGDALKAAGRRTQSVDAYRRSIQRAPTLGEAYWSLANLKTFRFAPTEIEAMRAQLARTALRVEDRLHFEFALGKALEDTAEYAESFAHYAEGNRLRRSSIQYEADDTTEYVRRSIALLTADFFQQRRDWGCNDRSPIFVIGLPRSGSTLIEQILASHSAVEGTKELTDVTRIARSLVGRSGQPDTMQYPEALAALDAAELNALGQRYLQTTRVHRKFGTPHFIDKMPNNWTHVGLIQLMLPNAKIIDARRHPMACCFSCFKQHFARGQPFTFSLSDVGRYYRDYVDLMAHIDEVLPGRIYRIHYERMVDDTQSEVRRLLDYCGLPYEDACLRFHENKRAISTASSEQVRQPIFAEAVDQWRKYEPWLGPLRHALGPAVEAYPGPT
jgi:tetratricopeptide (TPR) repeat protein